MDSSEWSTVHKFRAVSYGVGVVVALWSLLILVGWSVRNEALMRTFGPAPVSPLTALCFVLLGLTLLSPLVPGRWSVRLRWGLSLPVLGVGLMVLGGFLAGLDLGRPPLPIPMAVTAELTDAWRMSYTTAIAVSLLAAAALLDGRADGRPSQGLALMAFAFAYVVGLTILLRLQYLYGSVDFLPGMPLTLSLSLGVLCAHPDTGWMRVVTSQTPTGVMLRRLLPTAILLPPLLAWISSMVERANILETPVGTFFLVIVMTAAMLVFIGWNVRPVNRLEAARRRAVEALARSEAEARELAAIVESSEDAIISTDPELTTITFWNRGAEQTFGWTAEEAIGQPPTLTTPPERCAEFHAVAERLRQGQPLAVYESEGIRKDDTRLDVSVSTFPVKDAEGRIVGISTIQRDITERKRVVEEMARRTAELKKAEELNQLKDHFLSTISHEMKTPLSLIVGYTELLEDACPEASVVEGIKDGSRRLTEHIDHMLDYSALITGTLPLYRTEVQLAEVAENVRAMQEHEFQDKGLTLEVEIAPDTPELYGDSRRITQILHELLANAAKFTPAGGTVGLRIAPEAGQVRMDVWDTGPGIPEADFGRIWEAFTQLSIGDAVRSGGLGLGLTIVKKLVELHGGRVAVVSQVGRGTTFSVILPVGGEERAGAGEARGESRPGPVA